MIISTASSRLPELGDNEATADLDPKHRQARKSQPKPIPIADGQPPSAHPRPPETYSIAAIPALSPQQATAIIATVTINSP